jgi:hypothetical protein
MANLTYNRLMIEGEPQEVEQFVTLFKQDLFGAHVPIPDPKWKANWDMGMQGNPQDTLLPGFSEWMTQHWGVNSRLIEIKESIEEIENPEGLRSWFVPRFGGFPDVPPPESKLVVLTFETAWVPPATWAESVINQFDGKLSIAMYSINPNGCFTTISRKWNESDRPLTPNGIAITIQGDTTDHTNRIFQIMVRHFGFISEQFGWAPDFFHESSDGAGPAALDDAEIREEHQWVLRGRGEGDGYPQYFAIVSSCLPKKWFEYHYPAEWPYTAKNDHDMHEIMSLGLSNPELEQLQQAATASSVSRIMFDPAYKTLHRQIVELAVKEGHLERFDAELRAPASCIPHSHNSTQISTEESCQ